VKTRRRKDRPEAELPPVSPGGFLGGGDRRFEIEDVALVAWVLGLGWIAERLGAGWWQSPWIWAPTVFCLGICLFSLGPEDTTPEETELRRAVLGIPAALLLLSWVLRPGEMGWGRGVAIFLGLTVGVNSILAILRNARRALPTLGRTARRLLVAPAELVGIALFEGQVRPDLLDSAFLRDKPSAGRLVVLILATGLLYWSAVVGPRILAGGSKSPLLWGPRFALYLASVLFAVQRPGNW
jgi:hypothetical protein